MYSTLRPLIEGLTIWDVAEGNLSGAWTRSKKFTDSNKMPCCCQLWFCYCPCPSTLAIYLHKRADYQAGRTGKAKLSLIFIKQMNNIGKPPNAPRAKWTN